MIYVLLLTHVWFMAAVIPAWTAVLFKKLLKDVVRVSLYFNRKNSCTLESMKLDQSGLNLRDPHASASRVLGLKACAITTPLSGNCLIPSWFNPLFPCSPLHLHPLDLFKFQLVVCLSEDTFRCFFSECGIEKMGSRCHIGKGCELPTISCVSSLPQ